MEENEKVASNSWTLFEVASTNSLQNIARSISEDEFVQTLGVLRAHPRSARKLHEIMIQQLYKKTKEYILDEGSLREAILKVDKLKEESDLPKDQEAWRPPGDVVEHLRSLDVEVMKREYEELRKLVTDVENENEKLVKQITEDRAKIADLDKRTAHVLNRTPIALERVRENINLFQTGLKTLDKK